MKGIKSKEYIWALAISGLVILLAAFILINRLNVSYSNTLPYNLAQPDNKIKLPGKLVEVSGLSWFDKHQLAGIQDEEGYIFIIDTKSEKIVKKEKFTKDGDYEGVAVVRNKLYIVRSDGAIFKVKDFDEKDQKTKKFKTDLSESNDVEGLCYNEQETELLVLCKEKPGIKSKKESYRAIYSFDLEEKELSKKPKYKINLKKLNSFLNGKFGTNKKYNFKPSGIAIHPITNEIYVIASLGKLLVVLGKDGQLKDAEILDPVKFKQPEGITFDPEGNLYISNEGKNGKANILQFNYKGK
jgi:uncharacterized protein YjiK